MNVRLASCALVALFAIALAPTASAIDWYAEASFSSVDLDSTSYESIDAYGLALGARFGEHFGLQLDWLDIQQPTPPPCPGPTGCLTTIIATQGYGLRVLGRLPIGESFELVGGIGRQQRTNSGYLYEQTYDSISLSAGWRVDESWTLSVERRVLSGDTGATDLEISSFVLRYGF